MRKVLWVAGGVFVLLGVVFALGPRIEVAEAPTIGPPPPIDQLEGWLAASEARLGDVTPETEKQIVWADPQRKAQTPLSVIYLHGFSATRQEARPWPEEIAKALGANLFLARLRGHGRPGEELAAAMASDWLGDALEALAIGRRLGERVVVLGTSTGGSLAIWLASQAEARPEIAALVLMSPNLGIADPRQKLIFLPWGHLVLELSIGEYREWEPENEVRGQFWTTRYPVNALMTMGALQKTTAHVPSELPDLPTLVLYSPHDPILDLDAIKAWIAVSDQRTAHVVEDDIEMGNHVLAGDICAPSRTTALARLTADFVRRVAPTDGGTAAP